MVPSPFSMKAIQMMLPRSESRNDTAVYACSLVRRSARCARFAVPPYRGLSEFYKKDGLFLCKNAICT